MGVLVYCNCQAANPDELLGWQQLVKNLQKDRIRHHHLPGLANHILWASLEATITASVSGLDSSSRKGSFATSYLAIGRFIFGLRITR
jgi:hypothetical protein